MFNVISGEVFLVTVFLSLLTLAAVMDLRSFKITNDINLAVGITALAYQLFFGEILIAIAFAACVLSAGFILFAFKFLGGGDVKLLAASSLFMGFEQGLSFLFFTAVFGGLFALVWVRTGFLRKILVYYGLPVEHDIPQVIPYGVAIAAAGFFVTWQKFVI